ncbi:MAG: nuclear transport factor 2 family protein [Caulobacteraceae bacterium]
MDSGSPQACTADFTAALIGRDIDAALALLSDDIVFFYSNGTTIRGKDAFAAMMTSSWKLIENYKYSTLESAWITDAAAAVIYSFAWSGSVRDQEVSGSGRGTRVFCKMPEPAG